MPHDRQLCTRLGEIIGWASLGIRAAASPLQGLGWMLAAGCHQARETTVRASGLRRRSPQPSRLIRVCSRMLGVSPFLIYRGCCGYDVFRRDWVFVLDPSNEMGLSDEEDNPDERGQGEEDEETIVGERGRKEKREWKERPGAGLSAGKRQKLADAQDENFIRALDLQDEKAGRFYQETLTTGIDKLVGAITQASQPNSASGFSSTRESQEIMGVKEQLTKQEKQIAELAQHQVLVEKRLEEAAEQRAEAEKRNEERQQRMMELLERLTG